ncbi:hypothetical protein AS189_18985 [Arthrobacter alpinus]|uniref:Uncharacterized protein n=2 Tax=Arthrobacter alpinus TaxID=656366 RepID=A0A0S2M397_9MICC|nr:hypothetical protein AS189_18985 [Arthrobacter alpinus]
MNLRRGRIVHMLASLGPATAEDLAIALSTNQATLIRELSILSDAGIIRVTRSPTVDSRQIFAVDPPAIAAEMAQARQFFSPWL